MFDFKLFCVFYRKYSGTIYYLRAIFMVIVARVILAALATFCCCIAKYKVRQWEHQVFTPAKSPVCTALQSLALNVVFRAGFCLLLRQIRFPTSSAHRQDVPEISAENWGLSTTDKRKRKSSSYKYGFGSASVRTRTIRRCQSNSRIKIVITKVTYSRDIFEGNVSLEWMT